MPVSKTRKVAASATKPKKKAAHKTKLPDISVSKVIRLFILAFFAVAFSVFMVIGSSFYSFIKSSFANSGSTSNFKSINNGDLYTLSFIVLEDKNDDASNIVSVSYLIIDTKAQKLSIYEVPTDYELEYPQRIGKNKIEKAYALGQLLTDKKGVYLTNKVLENIFARKVDRYIVTDVKGLEQTDELFNVSDLTHISKAYNFGNILKTKEFLKLMHNDYLTNLTARELNITLNAFKVDTQSLIKKRLSHEDIATTYTLDLELKEFFADKVILTEGKRILVLNGTTVPGLAGYTSRYIENPGASIVGVGNTSKTYDKSFIIAQDFDSKTLNLISYQLGINDIFRTSDRQEIVDTQAIEADIIVVLGFDFTYGL